VKYIAGGHLVTVRSLRDGRRQQVADWLILCAIDNDLEWLGARYARQQRRARQTAGGYPRAAAAAARRAA
jgi:hypothetical protein